MFAAISFARNFVDYGFMLWTPNFFHLCSGRSIDEGFILSFLLLTKDTLPPTNISCEEFLLSSPLSLLSLHFSLFPPWRETSSYDQRHNTPLSRYLPIVYRVPSPLSLSLFRFLELWYFNAKFIQTFYARWAGAATWVWVRPFRSAFCFRNSKADVPLSNMKNSDKTF